MAAIVDSQLDKFGQYQINVSSSTPLVEEADPSKEKEVPREYHTKGEPVLRTTQSLDEEATLLWQNWQVGRQRSAQCGPCAISSQ